MSDRPNEYSYRIIVPSSNLTDISEEDSTLDDSLRSLCDLFRDTLGMSDSDETNACPAVAVSQSENVVRTDISPTSAGDTTAMLQNIDQQNLSNVCDPNRFSQAFNPLNGNVGSGTLNMGNVTSQVNVQTTGTTAQPANSTSSILDFSINQNWSQVSSAYVPPSNATTSVFSNPCINHTSSYGFTPSSVIQQPMMPYANQANPMTRMMNCMMGMMQLMQSYMQSQSAPSIQYPYAYQPNVIPSSSVNQTSNASYPVNSTSNVMVGNATIGGSDGSQQLPVDVSIPPPVQPMYIAPSSQNMFLPSAQQPVRNVRKPVVGPADILSEQFLDKQEAFLSLSNPGTRTLRDQSAKIKQQILAENRKVARFVGEKDSRNPHEFLEEISRVIQSVASSPEEQALLLCESVDHTKCQGFARLPENTTFREYARYLIKTYWSPAIQSRHVWKFQKAEFPETKKQTVAEFVSKWIRILRYCIAAADQPTMIVQLGMKIPQVVREYIPVEARSDFDSFLQAVEQVEQACLCNDEIKINWNDHRSPFSLTPSKNPTATLLNESKNDQARSTQTKKRSSPSLNK